jgi:hypothetical protein
MIVIFYYSRFSFALDKNERLMLSLDAKTVNE